MFCEVLYGFDPRDGEICCLAREFCGRVEWLLIGQRPKCQLISTSIASEAAPDISRQIGSDAWLSLTRTALRLCTAAQDTSAAEIAASAECWVKLQQLQHPRQRNAPTDCTIVDDAVSR